MTAERSEGLSRRQSRRGSFNVGFGSLADIAEAKRYVRFVPFADTIFPYFEVRDVCQLIPADTTVIGWRVLFG
jgi:hypothetical protein